MSAELTVAGTFCAVLGGVSLAMLPAVWRGWFTRRKVRFQGRTYSHGDAAFMFWGGPVVRRGLARSFVPMAFGWCGAVAGFWVAVANGGVAGQDAPPAAKDAAVVAVVWFGLCLLVVIPIVLFNWPKLLVPPGQRADPGAIMEWRSSRRRRRRRS